MVAIYDKHVVKFWGVAKDTISQDTYLMTCMLATHEKKTWIPCKKLDMNMVSCYESNYNRDRLYLGGTKSGVAVFCVITLDDKMDIECSKKFLSVNLQCVSNLKRIEGTDSILLSGLNSVIVLQYNKDRKQINTIHSFSNITEGDIESSIYFRGFLIVLSPLTGSLVGVKIPSEMNQNVMNHIEYPNTFAGGNEKVGIEQIQERTHLLQAEFQKFGGFTLDYFGGLLDNLIETTPKLLVESEDQTVDNFKMASVFSFDTRAAATRVRIDDETKRLYCAGPEGLRQFEIHGRDIKPIKGSNLKSSLLLP